MLISITIPTCKTVVDITQQINDIKATAITQFELIYSCLPVSAAINRNKCLDQVTGDIVIQLDDDITGFYKGWDTDLIQPLLSDPNISIVSARLLDPNGSYGAMMHNNYIYTAGWHKPKANFVPTACIAFRKMDLRFDEGYIRASFEDTDFCKQTELLFPEKYPVINNNCKLIHLNEMKFQAGEAWDHNKAYFEKKWGVIC